MPLKAGRRRRGRSIVCQEEEAAVALGYGCVLPLEPGRAANMWLPALMLWTVVFTEWIIDHG